MAFFVSMSLIPYAKSYATPAAKVAHLQARGLHVPRPSVAVRKIELIGYDRLRIYCEARRDQSLPHRPFLPGTTYRDILQLHDFDAKLRSLCFDACGAFEVLFRNALAKVLAQRHGPHPYGDPALYKSGQTCLTAMRTAIDVYAKTHDPRARHYRTRYDPPALPPIWMLKEFMTFGQANTFFKCLANPLQRSIGLAFALTNEHVFLSWVDALVQLRNVSAHHGRLFNHSFQAQPQMYQRAGLPTAPPQKLKAVLECLDHLTAGRGAPTLLIPKVAALMGRHPAVQPGELGF